VERLFTADDPGVFAVVQSSTDLPVGEVSSVAGEHFLARSVPTEPLPAPGSRSRLQERVRIPTRLAAQRVYRSRRALRRLTRRLRYASPQVEPPSIR
jgi:hypothetical protein